MVHAVVTLDLNFLTICYGDSKTEGKEGPLDVAKETNSKQVLCISSIQYTNFGFYDALVLAPPDFFIRNLKKKNYKCLQMCMKVYKCLQMLTNADDANDSKINV